MATTREVVLAVRQLQCCAKVANHARNPNLRRKAKKLARFWWHWIGRNI